MAGRGMSSEMIAASGSDRLRTFHLIAMEFATPARFAMAHRDITWNGVTYRASGDLLEVSDAEESTEIRANEIQITLSGVSQANLAQALLQEFIERPVTIRRGFFGADDAIVIGPVTIFEGRVDSWSWAEDPDRGTAAITWRVASHWVDFERTAGRRSNHEDQQLHYPGDRGLEHAHESELPLERAEWGSMIRNRSRSNRVD